MLDVDTLSALIGLFSLLAVVGGGILKLLWTRISLIEQRINDERVKSAERFVTVEELDRRLEQSLKPVTGQLDKLEAQNEKILSLLLDKARGEHRGALSG